MGDQGRHSIAWRIPAERRSYDGRRAGRARKEPLGGDRRGAIHPEHGLILLLLTATYVWAVLAIF